jgi:amino acid adenylation domain-containing protein/non-ribosomal peptide synthase protein (TIGR01720 family)
MSQNNIEAIYPLTPMQQGMLFHTIYSSETASTYYEWLDFPLRGDVDAEALKRAWGQVLERHPILRTAFVWQREGEAVQVVKRQVALPFEEHDWRGVEPEEQRRRLEALLDADRARGFELTEAPLMRMALIRMSAGVSHFVWSNHHLLLDGWSKALVLQEVFAAYRAAGASTAAALPPAPRPYRDYIAWLRRQDKEAARRFWQESLAGFNAPAQLPGSGTGAGAQGSYARCEARLGAEQTRALREMARRHRLTPNTIVQGAWALLLMRHAGVNDVAFGAVASGRPASLEGVERMVGLFINTLPVRARARGDERAAEWLKRLQSEQAGAREYEYVGLAEVQGWSEVGRGTPLFESVVVFENYPVDESLTGADDATAPDLGAGFVEKTNYPLTLLVRSDTELSLQLSFDCQRFDESAIERTLRHLLTLIESMTSRPDARLSELELIDADERRQLVEEWNDTRTELPGVCVHELFERRAASAPEAVALISDGGQMSYGELNEKANRLARLLRKRGVGEESRVGLLMERGAAAVVSVLAILKAGGAYVPLDPEYPRERLVFMLEDSDVRLVLTRGGVPEVLGGIGVGVVDLRVAEEELARESGADLECVNDRDSAAYIMYTSGSTGRPKGVLVTHRGVIRLVCNTDYISLSPADCVTQFATLSFDASTFELWGALLNGARLAVIPKEVALSPSDLGAELRRVGASTIFLTTALFNQVAREAPEALRSLRTVLFGGEAVDPRPVREMSRGGGPERLLHVYGPTENTTFSTWEHVREVKADARTVPIGRPIANSLSYVLDREMRLVPTGALGELYVGGEGLARGYVGRAALTAERFVPNPFANEPGTRLYKTGDVVRQRADGGVEFVGRADSQVKVRGYRIEPGEIEAALSSHEAVRRCAVLAREDEPGDRRLVAYVAADGATAGELREYLKTRLPEYMVPAAFVLSESLQLNANGKVDRKALPAPDYAPATSADAYVAPRDAVEEALCEVWAEVLRVERVGVRDNFFELGGDSILSIQVIARAARRGVRVTPRQLFEHQTVEALAAAAGGERVEAEQGVVSGEAPLTPIQQWFFERGFAEQHHFNQAVLLEVEGMSVEVLRDVVKQLVTHHDALRLRFTREADTTWRQHNSPVEPHDLCSLIDLSAVADADLTSEAERACTAVQRSLDLTRGPLLRAALVECGEGRGRRLLLTVHHLAVDGVSWRILLEDFARAYAQASKGEAVDLGPKTTSFKQWAERLTAYARTEAVRNQAAYWRRQSERAASQPARRREGVSDTAGAARVVERYLSAEATRVLLTRASAAWGTQINDLLLTALAFSAAELVGYGEGVAVELEGHGREEVVAGVDLSRTVGWFTTRYPVWLTTESELLGTLRVVSEALRGVPERGIGYGLLRYGGDLSVAETRPGLSFNYLGQFDQVIGGRSEGDSGLLRAARESCGEQVSGSGERPQGVSVVGSVAGGRLSVEWTYSSELYGDAEINEAADRFVESLEELAALAESGAKLPEAAPLKDVPPPEKFPLAKLDAKKLERLSLLLEEDEEEEVAAGV